MTSLVIWTSKVWSFGSQKFGHLEVQSDVISTSKIGCEDVRILNTSSTPKIQRVDVPLVIIHVLRTSSGF